MRLINGMWLTSSLICLWMVYTCSAALPNAAHDFDDFQAQDQQTIAHSGKPPQTNRLFNRAIRGPQNNAATPRISPQAKTAPATQKTTTIPPVQVETDKEPEDDAAKQEGAEDQPNPADEQVSSTTTSTEPPKRTVGGVVRPFRSNKDLLDSLKRRRQMQAQNGYTVVPPQSSTTTTEKPQPKITQQNNRKTSPVANKGPVPSADQTSIGSQKKSTANRRYNSKTNGVSSTTTVAPQPNEAVAEESNVATQSARSRTYPKPRRTS